MSGKKRYLLDTNAVVSLLSGNPDLSALSGNAEWIGISVISQIEFLAFPGISPEDTTLFDKFLERVEVIDIRHDDSQLIEGAIELRRKHSIKLPDAVITSSALLNNAVLVTGDRKLLSLVGDIEELTVYKV